MSDLEDPRPTMYLDLDGCIIDSRTSIASSFDFALRHHGLAPLSHPEIDALIGPPVAESFARLLHIRQSFTQNVDSLIATFRKQYALESLRDTTLVPGIVTALDALKKRAHLVVVTSKARFLAVPILESLQVLDRFEAIFGPAPDAVSEPKTRTLEIARTGRPTRYADCMVGDRANDINAGRYHGIKTVGVSWGSGTIEELESAGADYVIHDPEELSALLDEILTPRP